VRVKGAVNYVWWLSKTPFPKASNLRVLTPYSGSMKQLLQQGCKPKLRPSGHAISENFIIDNGAAIPPNLIAIANTESNSAYLRYCQENDIKPHPARFPADVPEFFVRMLTEENDLVVDPFAGSCVTGQVCESLHRRFICCEMVEEYLRGAVHRFGQKQSTERRKVPAYSLNHPAALWNGIPKDALPVDGGRQRSEKHAPRTTPLTVRVGYLALSDFAEILNKIVIAPLFTQVRPRLQGRFDFYTETN
jgi:site-specific DNA-methyltransferase (cytosine-N4-specific)